MALSRNSSSSSMTSAKKMFGDLPPSSTVEGIRFSAAYCMISRPVVVSPVKPILAMRGLEARALPISPPGPVTMLSDAGRDDVPDHLGQLEDRPWRGRRRLDHGAVAGGQRRCDLPRRHQEGEVERDDLADDAERLVEVIGDRVLVDLGRATLERPGGAGEVPEVVDRQRDVGGQRLTHRLAVLPASRPRPASRGWPRWRRRRR